MIIKILSRKSGTGQLINYLLKEEKTQAHQHDSLVITHNLRSKTPEKWTKEFEENQASRVYKRKDAVAVHHSIIAMGTKDSSKMSEAVLRDFAKQFIALRGPDSLHLIVAHYNTDSVHLHCVTSGVKHKTGLGNRLSKQDLNTLKHDLTRFQQTKYPELTHSQPDHGKKERRNGIQEVTRSNRETYKNQLLDAISKSFTISSSRESFIAAIQASGFEAYYRGTENRLTGFRSPSGVKFRLSTLGYPQQKLTELDDREQKKSELEELSDIRNSHESAELGVEDSFNSLEGDEDRRNESVDDEFSKENDELENDYDDERE